MDGVRGVRRTSCAAGGEEKKAAVANGVSGGGRHGYVREREQATVSLYASGLASLLVTRHGDRVLPLLISQPLSSSFQSPISIPL